MKKAFGKGFGLVFGTIIGFYAGCVGIQVLDKYILPKDVTILQNSDKKKTETAFEEGSY